MRLTIDRNTLSPRYEMLLTFWGHLQHELLYISWAVMDVALLTPIIMAIMGWARFWPPGTVFMWMLMLMLFSFNLTRLMSAVQLPPTYQQSVMALMLFGIILVTLPTFFHDSSSVFRFEWVGEFFQSVNERGNNLWLQDVTVFLTIVIVWARGLQLAKREYSINRAGLRLRVGGLILAPLVVWLANTLLLWDSGPYILLFFLAGLTAVALIRAEEIEKDQTGQALALDPRWLTAVLLSSLLTIFMAGVIAIIISNDSPSGIIGWLAPVWNSLRVTGAIAFTTLFFLMIPVLRFIDWITGGIGLFFAAISPWFAERWAYLGKVIGKFFIDQRVPLEDLGANAGNTLLENRLIFDEIEGLGIQLSRNVQIIIILLAVALILLVALLVNRLYKQTSMTLRQSGQVSSKSTDDLDDGSFLDRLLGRLGILRDWQTAVSIRRIYQKMLRAADGSGYPRLDTETPYEFLSTLTKAWPDHRQEAQLITSAYVKIRYGELPETEQELEDIKSAWRTLESTRPIEQIED